jgi:hypothetical protein
MEMGMVMEIGMEMGMGAAMRARYGANDA